jgi:hypothetical protein
MLPIEDRLAIEELLYDYATAMEVGDEHDLLALFTGDFALDSVVHGDKTGAEAIIEKSRRSQKNRDMFRLRRMFSNFRINGDGDSAHMTAYFAEFLTYLKPKPNNPYPTSELIYVGEFDCDVVKVDGKWLFKRRGVKVDSHLGVQAGK